MPRSSRYRLISRRDRQLHIGRYCRETITDGLLVLLRTRREDTLHAVDFAERKRHHGNAAAQLRYLTGLTDAALDIVNGHRRADLLVDRSTGGKGVMFE